jgi:hypothetical protein
MSTSELPEDLARWPENPYQILGVEPGVSNDALRRAYSERVRRFKPDQFPEHFQRIRAAYDTIRNRGGSGMPIFIPRNVPTAENLGRLSHLSSVAGPTKPDTRTADALADVAKRAANGDVSEAYQQMLRLQGAEPQREENYVWLYWLAVLFPKMAGDPPPPFWLLAGLEKARTVQQLAPLWQLELAHAPSAAMDAKCLRLITEGGRLTYELLRWRWEAAWMLAGEESFDGRHSEIIIGDLESLRSSRLHDAPQQWFQVLHLAVERLAWCTRSEGREACQRFVDELDDLVRLGDAAGRQSLGTLDFLLAAGQDWREIERHQREWVRAICHTCLCPDAEIEAILRRLLNELGRDPLLALERLDSLRKEASTLLWRLDQLIQELEAKDAPHQPNELETRALERFLVSCGRQTYAAARPKLFKFLIAECLLPEQAAAVLESGVSKGEGPGGLADTIRKDVPLRCACTAARHRWRPIQPAAQAHGRSISSNGS